MTTASRKPAWTETRGGMDLRTGCAVLLLGACTSEEIVQDTDDPTSTTDPDSTGAVDPSTDGSTGETTVPPGGDVPAAGIELRTVTVNQAVQIPVWTEDGWVGGEDRNAPLVPGRPGLVRASFELVGPVTPRLIEGRLHVVTDGDDQVFSAELDPTSDVDSAFEWFLEAEHTLTGAEFYIELFEVEPDLAPTPLPETPPRLPPEDTALFGFQAEGPVGRVVGVPLRHQVEDCDSPPPEDPDYGWFFIPALFKMLPVTDFVASLHEPIATSSLSADNIFAELMAAREADGEDPKTLYMGYLYRCPVDVAGSLSFSTYFDFEDVVGLAVINVEDENDDDGIADNGIVPTFGVTHGLGHVRCDGASSPAPVDFDYPYEDGKVGVPGYDILERRDIPQDAVSFMSFGCDGERWISDYEYRRVYAHYINE